MSRFDSQCSSEDVNKEDECVPSSSEDSQDGVSSPMENDDEPEFSQKHYDIEPCYYSLTGKSDRNCRGIVYRYRQDSDLKGFQSHDGTLYRLRDSVFVEVSQNEPYVIAAICGFKYTKRDHVVVKLTRYFRADDIPEISLNLMKQERAELEINPHLCPQSLNRELFNSELQITQPVSCLRGKCIVEYVKDVRHARTVADFSLDNDTFFFCLHYNQDSTKLASTHYAIRVGTSFQATLPPMAECSVGDDSDRDELLYRPNSIESGEEEDYIKLARCYRTYTLSGNHMLDSQKNARVSDLLMDEAIIQLHRSGYKIDDALSELNANDIILTTDVDNMTQDDAKKFAKGIKQLGKNFSRIHRELLPHHSREQLVSYYYLWKKTPEATKPKQAARRVNPTSIKRPTKEKVKASRPTSTEYLDFDSASESDVENNGPSGRACHHCYGAESKDWHHANGLLLCTDCRLHYKKYGQLRQIANRPSQVPACLFKRSNSDEEESGVRTRAGKKEQRRRTPSSMSETPDRRSPSTVSNGAPNLTAEETPTKKLNGSVKRAPKRPLHNGVINNVEKSNSSEEPASPTTPPPTLTNGLTNGHGPESSTPNGETISKRMKVEPSYDDDDDEEEGKMTIDEGDDDPMPVLNGFKKEESVEEIKLELNGTIKKENGVETDPTTPTCSMEAENEVCETPAVVSVEIRDETNGETNSDLKDDENVEPDSPEDTFELGSNVEFETKNAMFVRSIVRSCGPRCARTDLIFKIKVGGVWEKSIKEKEERKKVHLQNQRIQDSEKVAIQQNQIKKEQQQSQPTPQQIHQQQAQQNAQHLQQLQQAVMLGHLPPEVLRQMMPPQFGVDPTAILMQQMMAGQQSQGVNAAFQHQMALQQQLEAHQVQLMMAHQHQQKMIAEQQQQQRHAAAQQLREREQREQRERERERQHQQQAQQALHQQQQQHAAAAANQLNPAMMQMMALMANSAASQQDIARLMEMAAQQQQQQQQAAQAQAQRDQERERREREAREREAAREREREQAAREAAARDQAAREHAQAVQAAAAAAQQAQALTPDMQHMHLLQQLMLNPALMMQLQQAQAQQQQQQPQVTNPLQMLQHGMAAQSANQAEMMRRIHPEPAMRPQHQ
ncbi:Egg-laying defective protein 27 [Caenorhabditis elegans]|uniref:Egg-laying defective protein 27 n=4 Tax=Caenorhabditis elegans TaxID=6239 RepID=A0A0K3AUG2_CAEEL|nr:Egg-laying defective protein 27 [Caenorhabditis elegans]CTQ86435.1 Egg-laying defective protein 27 [Caenorhabditis elegans]|eukprot:NP_001300496.1 Egg-laying defective protein 27 [Caenorhabditis elegans]